MATDKEILAFLKTPFPHSLTILTVECFTHVDILDFFWLLEQQGTYFPGLIY